MGVSDKITSIAIPLGATVNMDVVSIVLSFMIVFFANACGVEVSTSMMIVILLANVILSVGTPGIPGGAIASFAALATMAGLPAGVMGVYISINTLCDMGATCVNVIGDMAGGGGPPKRGGVSKTNKKREPAPLISLLTHIDYQC